MTEDQRRALLRAAVPAGAATWLELGAGSGAFTLPLAERLGPAARILALDTNASALRELARAATVGAHVTAVRRDITDDAVPGALGLGGIAGALAANALHFLSGPDRGALLRRLNVALAPSGRLVVIEYDTGRATPWVPHPLPPAVLAREAQGAGFASVTEVARVHGSYGRSVYAAVCHPGTPSTA